MKIHTAQAGCTHEITGYLYFRSPDRDGGIINPDSDLFCGCPSEVAGMKRIWKFVVMVDSLLLLINIVTPK